MLRNKTAVVKVKKIFKNVVKVLKAEKDSIWWTSEFHRDHQKSNALIYLIDLIDISVILKFSTFSIQDFLMEHISVSPIIHF